MLKHKKKRMYECMHAHTTSHKHIHTYPHIHAKARRTTRQTGGTLKDGELLPDEITELELCESSEDEQEQVQGDAVVKAGIQQEQLQAKQEVETSSPDAISLLDIDKRKNATWEVVGGADKGGILVRKEKALGSQELPGRLSVGSLVEELELDGERLHYRRLTGAGPDKGWVSLKIKDKPLLLLRTPADGAGKAALLEPATCPPENQAPQVSITYLVEQATVAIAADTGFESANKVFALLQDGIKNKSLRPQLLLARGLLYWRWSRLNRALQDITLAQRLGAEEAPKVLLALRICLSQIPDARALAEELKEVEAVTLTSR